MIYSPTAQHALRALIYLAQRQDDGIPVRVSEIARAEKIPRQFLSKIMHDLRHKGLVVATKGPGGGFALARSSGQIALGNIVEAIDGVQDLNTRCILGLPRCSEHSPCPLHPHWKNIRERFNATIGAMTLKEAADTLK